MNATFQSGSVAFFPPAGDGKRPAFQSRRSPRKLLQPLFEEVAESSRVWRGESAGSWIVDGERHWIPRLIFTRSGEEPTIKLAIFAGIHGDEPAGVHALCDLVRSLEALPTLARQYPIHVYPLCNPTGYDRWHEALARRAGFESRILAWLGGA